MDNGELYEKYIQARELLDMMHTERLEYNEYCMLVDALDCMAFKANVI